jgi:hypothetical protein
MFKYNEELLTSICELIVKYNEELLTSIWKLMLKYNEEFCNLFENSCSSTIIKIY